MPPLLHRRELLRLAGTALIAGLAGACGTRPGAESSAPADPALRRRLHTGGRLISRPRTPSPSPPPRGLFPLQLSGSDRDGIVYVPRSYQHDVPAPLILSLHGAGGSAHRGLRRVQRLADAAGLILLIPDSRGGTWDLVRTGIFGPDVEYLDQALDLVFGRYSVDPARMVAEGFSDGASYALSLGLLNGDLFTHVIAFSPGFVTEGSRRGKPRVFVSHGVHDQVLPIELCGRRIARELRGRDYDVRYAEFDGGHAVPDEIARDAMAWLAAPG
jgi:phospholipase/carboxylesterase